MPSSQTPPDLIYVMDDEPGITRRKCGKGFAYYCPKGNHIKDKEAVKRINNLVIPPAWEKVWIAPKAKAHLQATGRDKRSRKQYRYHDLWIDFSKAQKYRQLIEFANALPTIRKNYSKDLNQDQWSFQKVAALAVAVMDSLHLRIGNNYYSEVNHTFGLTTLRRKHLNLNESSLELSFKGKTGKERNLKLEDRKLIRLVKECSDLPGYEVFRFKTKKGMKQLRSEDFNDYLRQISGMDDISSKNFRTWGANVLCLEKAEEAKLKAKDSRKKPENILVKMVAREMGHTINTCKTSYLHPAVLNFAMGESNAKKQINNTERDTSLEETEALLYAILKTTDTGN